MADDAVLGECLCVDVLCGETVVGVAVSFTVERLIFPLEDRVLWVTALPLPERGGAPSSREAIDVRVGLLPYSKRDRVLLLGDSESELPSGTLLDVLACLEGVPDDPDEGRGGTVFDSDVPLLLLTLFTAGKRRLARAGMGGGGVALVGLGLRPAGRDEEGCFGASLTWVLASSNTEVTGEARGPVAWLRRSCTTIDGITRSSPLTLTLEVVCSERSESDRGG